MKLLKKLFQRKPEVTVSTKDGESLTPHEKRLIESHWKCPDCGEGDFLQGPRGCGSQNVMCSNTACGSKFNFFATTGLFLADRISDKSPNAA